MRQIGLAAASVLALAGCDPEVPDSAAGVGFRDYGEYLSEQSAIRAERDAQLASANLGAPEATGAPTAGGATPPQGVSAADLAAAGIGVSEDTPATAVPSQPIGAPLAATAAGAAYVAGNSSAISQEAEYAREGIPARPADTGPDIVAYALANTQPVGQQVYARTLPSAARAARKCATYPSDDMAQLAFLESGGPQKDRLGIDPDGDGFACSWDPGRYRRAVGG